jgi:hypothetical protein
MDSLTSLLEATTLACNRSLSRNRGGGGRRVWAKNGNAPAARNSRAPTRSRRPTRKPRVVTSVKDVQRMRRMLQKQLDELTRDMASRSRRSRNSAAAVAKPSSKKRKSIATSSRRRRSLVRLPQPQKRGVLERYGYHARLPATERRQALERAIRDEGVTKVYRRLGLIRTLQKNKPAGRAFESDVQYLHYKYYHK